MAKKDPMDEIFKEIKKAYNDAVKELAEEIAFEIEKTYGKCIDAFYWDYDPVSYDRTYSTYLASSAADNPLDLIQQNGNTFTVGTEVSSDFIPGNPYRMNKNLVFERTFYKGIHGMNRNDYIRINKKRGREDRIVIKNIPKNMNPAPKEIMDQEFKRLTKRSNLDKMFNQKLNQRLNK